MFVGGLIAEMWLSGCGIQPLGRDA